MDATGTDDRPPPPDSHPSRRGLAGAVDRFLLSQRQTVREKAAVISALNLFFGALIGANLGEFSRLSLSGYILLITLLAGSVMVLRLVSMSERRHYKIRMLLLYLVTVPGAFFLLGRKGEADPVALQKLTATLVIWLGLVLITEATPPREGSAASPVPNDDQAG